MKKEEMKFQNICCYSCATTIEKELTRIDGVKDAYIEYSESEHEATLSIKFDEEKIDTSKIEEKAKEVISRFDE